MEYLVNVGVHGISGLTFGIKDYTEMPDPYVVVTVFGDERRTHYLENTASGSFHYFFTYTAHLKPQEFAGQDAVIAVWHAGRVSDTKLGDVVFSFRQVWRQPNRTVKKCWVPIDVPEAPGEVRGYVQVTVGTYGPGDIIPRLGGPGGDPDTDGDDGSATLRSRLVQPPSINEAKSLYQLAIRIYGGDGIRALGHTFSSSVDPVVEVSFNGIIQRTKVQSGSSPLWNEEIKVPVTLPCWDDSVNVTLFSSGGLVSPDYKLGELALYVGELQNAELKPTWYNFYYSPEEEESRGSLFDAKADEEISAFGGRILVGASIDRVDAPASGVIPADAVRHPASTKCTLWLDIYELVFDSQKLPGQVRVEISMAPLEEKWEFAQSEKHAHAFVWPDDNGRATGRSIPVPPTSMGADMFINVYTREDGFLIEGSWTRHMFTRLPMKDIMQWDVRPDWYEMRLVLKNGEHRTGGFILLSVNMGPDTTVPRRPQREHLELESYMFRAHIYQAVNLPCKDESSTCDAQIIIFFGSAMIRTSIMEQCVTPTWYESREALVEVPSNVNLRPDIFIYVVDVDISEKSIEPLAQIKYETSVPGNLPEKWTGPPVWLNFQKTEGGPINQAKALVKFELVPVDSQAPVQSIRPETTLSKIEFFVLGVRMKNGYQNIPDSDKPAIELSWGRQEEDRRNPIAAAYVKNKENNPIEGEHGFYNYLQKASLEVPLARDHLYQEYVEVRLLHSSGEKKNDAFAFGTIHLTPLLPWISSTHVRGEVRKKFQLGNYEDLKIEAERQQAVVPSTPRPGGSPRGSPRDGEAPKKAKPKKQEVSDGMSTLERRLCDAIGWNHPSIDASNKTVVDGKDYSSLTDVDADQNKETLITIKNHRRLAKKKSEESEATVDPKKGAKLQKRGTANDSDTFDYFNESFKWPLYQDDGDDALDGHPEFDHELELDQLPDFELPYLKASLFVGSPWGEQVTIGTLKYLCRIVDVAKKQEGSHDYEEAEVEWKATIKAIKAAFAEAKFLSVRAFLLSADGLIPRSGRSDPSTYLWSRTTDEDTDRKNADTNTVRQYSLHPEFFKVHVFERCQLPQNSTLELKVIEQITSWTGGISEEKEIGNSCVDLEDRFFHPRYKKWFKEDCVPIEARPLRTTDSMFNRGHVRLWIEVMTADVANNREMPSLPSSDPRPFQLRMVIWRATNIVAFGDSEPDVYVTGKHTLDDGTILEKETDTHYACNDEIATWNWRWVFDLKIPCQDPRVTLDMWDHNLISASEKVGEATLDLGRDFLHAKKHGDIVEIPRGTVPMTHPVFPGQVRAMIDLEAVLMPQDEALISPVGEGWEEPNQDPFVDAEDPHLVAHRGMLSNLDAVKNLKYAGKMLFAGFGLMGMLYVAAAAISGLAGLVTTIILVTSG